MKVLVGNDDGFQSTGIDALARAAQKLGDVQIIAPERQQTATSKGLTFNHPLRIHRESSASGLDLIAYNGLPADSIAIYEHIVKGHPDVVISGINGGENTSIHSILTSGTCAVAMEAGLRNVPSFAFSMDVPEEFFFSKKLPFDLDRAGKIAISITKTYLKASEDFWNRTLFVNVNFPHDITDSTKIEVVDLDNHKYNNYLSEREDPKGEKYYWLWGEKRKDFDKTRDSYKVLFEDTITITPVMLKSPSDLIDEAKGLLDGFTV